MANNCKNYHYNNNYNNLKSKGNNPSEGQENLYNLNSNNGGKSRYTANNNVDIRYQNVDVRYNNVDVRYQNRAQYNGYVNTNTQNYPLTQRTVTHEAINPRVLTGLFKQCKEFENLKTLFNEHKDKPYFNSIHASACFSQAIKFKCEKHESITPEELTVFKDKIFSYSKELNPRTLSNLANDAVKLLHYGKNKSFKDAQEFEKIAHESLACVFKEVNSREKLEDFQPQTLSNLANDAVKLLVCAQNKNSNNLEDLEKLASKTLECIFREITNLKNIQHFDEQPIANLSNCAMKFLCFNQNKNFNNNLDDLEKLACTTLSCIFQEVTNKESLKDFQPQQLANIANVLVQAGYWDETTSELLNKIGISICLRNFNTFDLQAISNLAWAFSAGNQFSLIHDWLIKGLNQLDWRTINLCMEGAKQLYMAFLKKALDDKKWNPASSNAFLTSYLNKDLAQKILQEFNEEAEQSYITTSLLQKNVRSALEKVLPRGYSLHEEYYIKPYPIDFAIFKHTGNGKYKQLIALIEVNGPTHFMCNGDYNLPHQLKENLIESKGYPPIINVSHLDWNKLRYQDQDSFLKKKLPNL